MRITFEFVQTKAEWIAQHNGNNTIQINEARFHTLDLKTQGFLLIHEILNAKAREIRELVEKGVKDTNGISKANPL